MRGNLICSVLSVCAVTFIATIASGQIIAQHSGSNDPTTEHWAPAPTGSFAPITAGPVTNDLNNGIDAWSLALPGTPTNSISAEYFAGSSQANTNAALINGWELTANLRFPGPLQSKGLFFVDILFAGIDPSCYELIFAPGQDGLDYRLMDSIDSQIVQSPGPLILLPDPTDYHLFQLRYDSASKSANLFVDGVQEVSNFRGGFSEGSSTSVEWILFRSGTDSVASQVNVNLLQLAVVPEPSTLTLLAVGAIGLAVRRRRQKI
jgi:PEP-CTERM motif